MAFKIKIENLEEIIEKAAEKLAKSDSHAIRCKGANLEQSPVHALIIYSQSKIEVRCPRYEKGSCHESKTEKDATYTTTSPCPYTAKK